MNVIILNGFVEETDVGNLFDDEPVSFRSPLTDMLHLLVEEGCFVSRSQARKNWKGPIDIPDGWCEFRVGKGKKNKRHICIWNPTEGL